jgi:2-succinyl-6-hydroxy-2,4-cyclohexadiene-1-carboxylate synthase
MEAAMQEKRVKVDQIELQIRDFEQDAEAIIFLHFSGANLMMWQRAIPYFQDQYRLILIDLRGHGRSDKPATGYHMDDMARDVIGVMQQLKLDRAHIVGSSLGAEVGLSLAANYPEKVLSLVCDGALSSEYGPYGTWEGSLAEFEEHVTHQLEKMHSNPEKIYPSIDALVGKSREVLSEIGWWNEYVEAMERYGAFKLDEGKYTQGFRKYAREDYMGHYFHYRLEDYYRKVECPLLMLPGEDVFENEREKSAMEGLRELAPQAQIIAVSGWVHPYGWLLNPENMCGAILSSLGDTAK